MPSQAWVPERPEGIRRAPVRGWGSSAGVRPDLAPQDADGPAASYGRSRPADNVTSFGSGQRL
jgi:hypothetical protein